MDMARLAAEHGLERVGGRPSLPQYVKQLLNRSDFTYTLAKYRMQSENERNRLGPDKIGAMIKQIGEALPTIRNKVDPNNKE